ncbi:hypothetical protein Hdeb2414_s0017g00502341 [Helianthus debilis subsp. tardiflorus]
MRRRLCEVESWGEMRRRRRDRSTYLGRRRREGRLDGKRIRRRSLRARMGHQLKNQIKSSVHFHISNMSCTSPWDWSMDPQPGQDQTSAAAWARNMFPQPSISASQWALLSNQNQNIQNLVVARGEGYAATRKTRHDLLKKKFESFHFLENETLNDITTRYYHLMCEMYYFGVLASQQEMVARFADALPPKWSPFIELLKHTGVLDAVNVNIY